MTTFEFGFMIFILPFLVVMLWEIGREKIQNVWLDGYAQGEADYIESQERWADAYYEAQREG